CPLYWSLFQLVVSVDSHQITESLIHQACHFPVDTWDVCLRHFAGNRK
ncbi:hypothetical protein scyTo_0021059, partial [Scyliorhinus torazame]|nr:hypothetical protein [Scyliorhinus torazame]